MSGLPPLATELRTSLVVRFVPKPEVKLRVTHADFCGIGWVSFLNSSRHTPFGYWKRTKPDPWAAIRFGREFSFQSRLLDQLNSSQTTGYGWMFRPTVNRWLTLGGRHVVCA